MTRWLAMMVLLMLAVTVVAENDEVVLARVIDSSLERVPLQTIAPEYPRKARRDRIEGEVQVCFEVDRKGRPRRVAVRHSSDRVFEKPSLKAVKASRFRPLGKEEPLQAIKSCRTFIFALEPVDPSEY